MEVSREESERQIDIIHESLKELDSLQINFKQLKLNDNFSDDMFSHLKYRLMNRLAYIESLYNQD